MSTYKQRISFVDAEGVERCIMFQTKADCHLEAIARFDEGTRLMGMQRPEAKGDVEVVSALPVEESEAKPKTEICDCCDEEWEEDFFCQACSDEGHLEEWDETVSTEFDIDGPFYTTVMQQELVYYHTCLNCCWCGVRKPSAGSTTQGFVDDEEIPF